MQRPFFLFGSILLGLVSPLAWAASAGTEPDALLPDTRPSSPAASLQNRPLHHWDRLAALLPGTELRVSLEGARTLKGKLENVTEETLTLRIGRKSKTIAPAEVVRIHQLRRDSLDNGLLLGMAVGVAAGAAWGAGLAAHEDINNMVLLFTVPVGAAAGTAIGAAADSARIEWLLVYERPTIKTQIGPNDNN
ncbi:MAG: hypothetical protein GWN58_10115 [Anaerolineae bacterium]|nr:hypothetical protein [Anaerolineae bacterium]